MENSMRMNLLGADLEIRKEHLNDFEKLINAIHFTNSNIQVFRHKDNKEIMLVEKDNDEKSKNWLKYIIYTNGKKVNRISRNHVRQACSHDNSTNYWTTLYKRHWWN